MKIRICDPGSKSKSTNYGISIRHTVKVNVAPSGAVVGCHGEVGMLLREWKESACLWDYVRARLAAIVILEVDCECRSRNT
jgi:hypothetical protein